MRVFVCLYFVDFINFIVYIIYGFVKLGVKFYILVLYKFIFVKVLL